MWIYWRVKILDVCIQEMVDGCFAAHLTTKNVGSYDIWISNDENWEIVPKLLTLKYADFHFCRVPGLHF